MVSNGGCAACLAIWSEAQRKANPEKQKAAIAKHKAANREKINAENLAYNKAHRPQINARRRANRAKRLVAKLATRVPDPSDYTGPVLDRVAARAAGLIRYFTGKPCINNHLSERLTSNGGCIKCNAITLKALLHADGTPQQAKLKAVRRVVKIRRRGRESNADGEFTAADIQRIGDRQKWKCHWCGKPTKQRYHIDHLIPLAKGGSNWPSNLVIACAGCNQSKGATDPIDYAQRLGRLL